MKENIKLTVTDWDKYYIENITEEMPWYSTELDSDLLNELNVRNLNQGKFIDIGTGPGTQAGRLAESGFEVTGTDLSVTAVNSAKQIFPKVNFIADNILNSDINDKYDYIFDRGCFHVIPIDKRNIYVENLINIIKPGGLYFLKCFSTLQAGTQGPHRVSDQEINDCFGAYFEILSIKQTEYQGVLKPNPKAVFAVLRFSGKQ